ncbi:MAG: hypothetical protein DYG89_09060 [Caldilinea sp. CFX5]|nr:hypothetical protein [Caldilinea sp. CFX5]
MKQPAPSTIDEYIARFSAPIQAILQQIRATIRAAAPAAKEVISYQMPAFHQEGNLVYFAAWKEHIGFYPPVSAEADFKQELAVYEGPKGNLQFPLDQPIPYDLITKIVQQRLKENLAHAALKGKRRESRK